jgi:hypothetical protein
MYFVYYIFCHLKKPKPVQLARESALKNVESVKWLLLAPYLKETDEPKKEILFASTSEKHIRHRLRCTGK